MTCTLRTALAALALVVAGAASAQSQLWEWRGSEGATIAAEPGDVFGLYVTFDFNGAGVVATRRFASAASFVCGRAAFADLPGTPPGGATWPTTGYRCYRMARGGASIFGGVNWESASHVLQAIFVLGLVGLGFHGYRSGQLS